MPVGQVVRHDLSERHRDIAGNVGIGILVDRNACRRVHRLENHRAFGYAARIDDRENLRRNVDHFHPAFCVDSNCFHKNHRAKYIKPAS